MIQGSQFDMQAFKNYVFFGFFYEEMQSFAKFSWKGPHSALGVLPLTALLLSLTMNIEHFGLKLCLSNKLWCFQVKFPNL